MRTHALFVDEAAAALVVRNPVRILYFDRSEYDTVRARSFHV